MVRQTVAGVPSIYFVTGAALQLVLVGATAVAAFVVGFVSFALVFFQVRLPQLCAWGCELDFVFGGLTPAGF